MPTILFVQGWPLFFYSNEGSEPMHVHARKGDTECKFWLHPELYEIEEEWSCNLGPPLAHRRDSVDRGCGFGPRARIEPNRAGARPPRLQQTGTTCRAWNPAPRFTVYPQARTLRAGRENREPRRAEAGSEPAPGPPHAGAVTPPEWHRPAGLRRAGRRPRSRTGRKACAGAQRRAARRERANSESPNFSASSYSRAAAPKSCTSS